MTEQLETGWMIDPAWIREVGALLQSDRVRAVQDRIIWPEELDYREEERNRIAMERLRYMLNPEGQPEVVLRQYLCALVDRGQNVVKRAYFAAPEGQPPVIIVLEPNGNCFCAEGLVGDPTSRYFVFSHKDAGTFIYQEVRVMAESKQATPAKRPKRILDL